jgi:VanZ family protein
MTPAGFDKVAHFGLYFVLGALAGRAWRVDAAPNALLVIVLALAVGAGDELHQRGVPTRTADPLDFAADATGVLLGFAALAARRWRISTE